MAGMTGSLVPPPDHAPIDRARERPLLPGLSIVVACFDDAGNVAGAIRRSSAAARRTTAAHEIIVVDDGSADDTAEIARSFVDRDPHLRVIVHAGHLGYGAALRSGIRAARMPWLLLTDADAQLDLTELDDFVPHANTADLLLGWRILRDDRLGRRMNAATWNWLVRRLFRLPIRDVDCAFKLVRADVVKALPLDSDGPMINTELLVRAIAAGARLEQLGVHRPARQRPVNGRSGASPRVLSRALLELIRLHLAVHRRTGPASVLPSRR